jgi:hypothetical protein
MDYGLWPLVGWFGLIFHFIIPTPQSLGGWEFIIMPFQVFYSIPVVVSWVGLVVGGYALSPFTDIPLSPFRKWR